MSRDTALGAAAPSPVWTEEDATFPLLRPLLARRAQASLDGRARLIPHGPAVVRVDGSDPDRVLLVGSGPVSGAGVSEHDDALSGAVARELAARTGRGAWVEARGRRQVRLAELPELVRTAQLHRFDAFVIVIGMFDAADGISTRAWSRALRQQLDSLQGEGSRDAAVVLTGTPPFSSVAARRGPVVSLVDGGVSQLNAETERIARSRPATTYAVLPAPGAAAPLATAAWYRQCGIALAEALVPMLDQQRGR